MQVFNNIHDVNVEAISDGQLYIYVVENNPQGNIKIGRSRNPKQRLQSLSGSNSGGNKIGRCAISDVTYLYVLEQMAHDHFEKFRISGTEWFDGEQMTFEDAINFVESLFHREDYEHCNAVRKKAYEMGIYTNRSVFAKEE